MDYVKQFLSAVNREYLTADTGRLFRLEASNIWVKARQIILRCRDWRPLLDLSEDLRAYVPVAVAGTCYCK